MYLKSLRKKANVTLPALGLFCCVILIDEMNISRYSYGVQGVRSMVFVGMRELKNKTKDVLGKAETDGVVILTSNGKTRAAIVPLKEEDVEDFLAAHNPKIREAVLKGYKDAKKGSKSYAVTELKEDKSPAA